MGDVLDEPTFGTAAVARGWVALEQPGPWGRDAATQSHLDPALGHELARRTADAGGRMVLVRGTGPHADDHHARPRRAFVASCVPGRSWLLTAEVADPRALASLDVDAVVNGDLEATRASLPELTVAQRPVVLVCTNGRRDVCCAVRGRPVAQAAAAARPGQVWETSHTGGHRFAPTGVLLPSGLTLARLRSDDVVLALDAAGRNEIPARLLGPRHDRGRSALTGPEQAAESAVRALTGEWRLDGIRVGGVERSDRTDAGDIGQVSVQRLSPNGDVLGRWRVDVRRDRRGPDRRVSCGKPVEEQIGYAVDIREA